MFGVFKANSLQQGFILNSLKQIDQDNSKNVPYIIQEIIEYKLFIDEEQMKQVWKSAQKKYCALRLRFDWQQDLLQIIDKEQDFDWRSIDLSEYESDVEKQEIKVKEIQENTKKEGFKLDKGNLIRINFIKQNQNLFKAIITVHHIILDGLSVSLLIEYVHQVYRNLQLGHTYNDLEVCDEAYINAQIYLQEHKNDHLDYWKNQTSQIYERPNLNGLLKEEVKYKIKSSEYENIKEISSKNFTLEKEHYNDLRNFCTDNSITVSSVLQYAWHKTLSVYGHSNQTVVGTVVSTRNMPIENIQYSVGLFINTLPLIVNHDSQKSIIDEIKDLQLNMYEIIAKSSVNLTEINKDQRKFSIFDSLFNFLYIQDISFSNSYFNSQKIKTEYTSECTLEVEVSDDFFKKYLNFKLIYANEIFDENSLDEMLQITRNIIFNTIKNGQRKFSEINILEKESIKTINEINNSKFAQLNQDDRQRTIHSYFEEIAEEIPEKTAVIYKDNQLSFKSLNEQSNMLAHYFRSICEINPDDVIALLLDKSHLMIVTILAVWKSGAAYVPIDLSFPKERIEFILQDTKAKILVSSTQYLTENNFESIFKVDLDSIFTTIEKKNEINNLSQISKGHNLAFIIFTSGTTGKPKGAMIQHSNMISFLKCLNNIKLNSQSNNNEDCFAFLTNYVFDASIEDILMSIFQKNILLVIDTFLSLNEKNINQFKISSINTTPSILKQIHIENLKYLKNIFLGGEYLDRTVFENIRKTFNGTITNGYGPSETTITNFYCIFYKNESYKNSIGKPLTNTKIFILSKNMQMVPINAIGELHITGDCVGRGYLNRPELTEEKFIPNIFQTEQERIEGRNSKLYKTGDLVRMLPNGELEYLGRGDMQVKIRGLRIDLPEIEYVLTSYQTIKQAVVIAKEFNIENTLQKVLIGYYVSEHYLDESLIKEFMLTKLPAYMVPNRIIHMQKIPLTSSGKVNTRALPDVDISIDVENYVAPRNNIEKKLCEI